MSLSSGLSLKPSTHVAGKFGTNLNYVITRFYNLADNLPSLLFRIRICTSFDSYSFDLEYGLINAINIWEIG